MLLLLLILLPAIVFCESIYHSLVENSHTDLARHSQIEASRSERGSPSPCGKGDEEDRFGKAAASQNENFQLEDGIIKITDLNDIKTLLLNTDERDLVVFDVDNTLIIPVDLVLRKCGEEFFLKQFSLFSEDMALARIKLLASKILLERKTTLVHENLPEMIQKMQSRSVKVIAFTSLMTGSFGAIKNIEDWRIHELFDLGIDFSSSFKNYNHIIFGDLKQPNSLPVFKNGILFSSRHTKGEVLRAFLLRVKWLPKRLIVIDDELLHLESILQELEKLKIDCHCYHFQPETQDELDESIAMRQFIYLETYETWLSDKVLK